MSLLPSLPAWSADHGLISLLLAVEDAFAPTNLLYAGLFLAAVCLVRGQVRASVFIAATMWLTSYATTELKSVFGRERPPWQLAEHVHNGGSFPSGHSSAIAAFVGVVVVLAFVKSSDDRARRIRAHLVAVAGVLTVLAIGADRLLLGRHYPTDLMAGWLLAGVITLLVALATGVVRPRTLFGGRDSVATEVERHLAEHHGRPREDDVALATAGAGHLR